jgi:hypothetical protein
MALKGDFVRHLGYRKRAGQAQSLRLPGDRCVNPENLVGLRKQKGRSYGDWRSREKLLRSRVERQDGLQQDVCAVGAGFPGTELMR